MVMAACLPAMAPQGLAQGSPSTAEYQIKAAYLLRFLGFIEWPAAAFERADAALQIGVLGAPVLVDELALLVVGRNAQGRPVQVRRLRAGEPLSELQVLFVGRGEAGRLPALQAAARERAVLIVSEVEEAPPRGSGINFIVVDDKVRFDIDVAIIERAGLRISARLLTVARKVMPGGPPS